MDQERQDLLSDKRSNNTTSAYKKTGVYPFDPNCWAWTEAIENLGQSSKIERDEKRKVQYEAYPKEGHDLVRLSQGQRHALWEGMDIDAGAGLVNESIVAKL